MGGLVEEENVLRNSQGKRRIQWYFREESVKSAGRKWRELGWQGGSEDVAGKRIALESGKVW